MSDKPRGRTLNELANDACEIACSKGWHDKPVPVAQYAALIHSEVSEMYEEHRAGRDPGVIYFVSFGVEIARRLGPLDVESNERTINDAANGVKFEGIPMELADVIIRVLDMACDLGIDIEAAVEAKMAFNATRPHKHGGKRE
jgi:NTP pyrophosphatase (non-canonical NTP hydrolase)